MNVLLEEQHDLPLVSVHLLFRIGSLATPEGCAGLPRHALLLLRRGAAGRSRTELDLAFDALGATLEVQAAHDAVALSARCLERHLDQVLALLADVTLRPDFPAAEHEVLRRETIGILDDVRDDDASLASRWFDHLALPSHAYGTSLLGSEDSLSRLALDDVVVFARAHLAPDRAFVGLAGDVERAQADARLRAVFGTLATTTPIPPPGNAPAFRPGRHTYVIDKPERTQAQILVGHPAPPPSDPAFLPLEVAATVLGGSFTSRLMTEVRVKRGWSYGAHARLARARHGHSVRLHVFPALAQAPEALALVLTLWEQIVSDGVSQAELDFVTGYMIGRWAFEVDTADARLGHRLDAWLMDLAPDEHLHKTERLREVTLDQVNEAIQRWWRPKDATILLTATAGEVVGRLESLGDSVTGPVDVLPYDAY